MTRVDQRCFYPDTSRGNDLSAHVMGEWAAGPGIPPRRVILELETPIEQI